MQNGSAKDWPCNQPLVRWSAANGAEANSPTVPRNCAKILRVFCALMVCLADAMTEKLNGYLDMPVRT